MSVSKRTYINDNQVLFDTLLSLFFLFATTFPVKRSIILMIKRLPSSNKRLNDVKRYPRMSGFPLVNRSLSLPFVL